MAGGTRPRSGEGARPAASEAEGPGLRAIAARLGRAASTISRELRRNALPRGGHPPVPGEGCHLERRQRAARPSRPRAAARGPDAGADRRLAEAGRGARAAPRLARDHRRLRRPGRKAERLWKPLPRGRARRGRRRPRPPRSTIAGRRSIHDRPEGVEGRHEAGRRAGDLPIRRRPRPVLVPKGREARSALAARLAGKSAAGTVAIMVAVARRLDPRPRSSITLDNGAAFARHGLPASACATATRSCDAYASWRKGAVGNANGRLRRDPPRDPDALTDAELREIVLSHDLTPRRCLGCSRSLAGASGSASLDPLRFVPEATDCSLQLLVLC
jgi:transposase, IS30 family